MGKIRKKRAAAPPRRKTIRVAIIGAGGRAAGAHYPCLAQLPGCDLVAACDIDEERLGGVCDRFGVAGRYTDFRQMIETEKPDAIYAFMPPHHLYDVAADIRVTRNHYTDGWRLRDKYLTVPGVSSVSPAYRAGGEGLPDVSRSFRLLALESQELAYQYAKDRYDVGLTNAFDFSQSKLRYDNARIEENRTKFEYIFKLKVLELYFGVPANELKF